MAFSRMAFSRMAFSHACLHLLAHCFAHRLPLVRQYNGLILGCCKTQVLLHSSWASALIPDVEGYTLAASASILVVESIRVAHGQFTVESVHAFKAINVYVL